MAVVWLAGEGLALVFFVCMCVYGGGGGRQGAMASWGRVCGLQKVQYIMACTRYVCTVGFGGHARPDSCACVCWLHPQH